MAGEWEIAHAMCKMTLKWFNLVVNSLKLVWHDESLMTNIRISTRKLNVKLCSDQ